MTGDRVRAGGRIYADKVAVTTGIWSGPLVKQLGLSVPISRRGYHRIMGAKYSAKSPDDGGFR